MLDDRIKVLDACNVSLHLLPQPIKHLQSTFISKAKLYLYDPLYFLSLLCDLGRTVKSLRENGAELSAKRSYSPSSKDES